MCGCSFLRLVLVVGVGCFLGFLAESLSTELVKKSEAIRKDLLGVKSLCCTRYSRRLSSKYWNGGRGRPIDLSSKRKWNAEDKGYDKEI